MLHPPYIAEPGWAEALAPQLQSEGFGALQAGLTARVGDGAEIYPPAPSVFAAFNKTPFEQVRTVILGQDPYHGPGQAMGLSFSVPEGVKAPPSLRNILTEVERDLGQTIITGGDLTPWTGQGVLLLNAVLTVEQGAAGAHAGLGWEAITDGAIAALSDAREGIVFLLWGGFAQKKKKLIDQSRHLVLETTHPSPLSAYRGFNGCGHFSAANRYLIKSGREPIRW